MQVDTAAGVDRAIVGVAAHGLLSATQVLLTRPLGDHAWQQLMDGVHGQRMSTLLARAVSDGSLAASTQQCQEALAMASGAAGIDLQLEARLLRTVERLEAERLNYRVLKGSATAHFLYSDPSLRSFCDVDVLVGGDDFDVAVATLAEDGGHRRYAEARRGFDRRFAKGASFRMPDGFSVDLHRTLAPGPYGFTIDLAGLLSRSATFTLAGRELTCLEHHDAFLHACLHAALGDWPPRLVPLRDVAQFLETIEIDVDLVLARARSWRLSAVLAHAIDLARTTLNIDGHHPLVTWAMAYRPRPWEKRALALYGPGRSYRGQALAAVRFVPGSVPKLAYVRDLAFPNRSYLAEREGAYVRRWLRAAGAPARRSLRRDMTSQKS